MTATVDLVVTGTIVNVNTATLDDGAVAIDNGEIVALAERPADTVIETNYIAPGLIDAHVHVESSMVTLPRYAAAVIPRGVTSIIHDPHEIGNVLGAAGVRSLLSDAADSPLKARIVVPSSVPASHLQDGGATIDVADVASLLDEERVVALGEVMNIPGLLAGDESVHGKIKAARKRGMTVDGHMPRVRGSDLQEAARFLDNDHESITLEEAREKVHAGLRVYLREGSSSKNLEELVPLIDEVDTRRLSLCTDDRDVVDLIEHGGIDAVVRKAIDLGVDPITTVQLATINTAESYGLPFGRIEPGAPADLVLLSDLETWSVEHTLIDGIVDPVETAAGEPTTSAIATDTVQFEPVEAPDLALSVEGTDPVEVRVIDAVGGLQTSRATGTVPVEDGRLDANLEDDILPLAVIERHDGGGSIGRGFVHGLGLDRGAIASTVAHDAHNCIVAGVDHEAMARVANDLRAVEGGIATYDPETDSVTSLSLPVAGLMSDQPLATVKEQFEAVEQAARGIGLDHPGGFMELSFLALEVIPEYRLSNRGLVDVESFDFVEVIVSQGDD